MAPAIGANFVSINKAVPFRSKPAGGLIPKLFRQHPLVEGSTLVEHHEQVDGLILFDFDAGDKAVFGVVGDGVDGAFVVLENLNADMGAIAQDRTAPAPWTERTNWRQGKKGGGNWQNGTVG